MNYPPRILVIALVSVVGGLLFLANTVSGNSWPINNIYGPSADSPGLLPVANAIGKDLMLDVSPQLHPSVVVGQAANGVKFLHWIDTDISCEDCLRLEIPDTGDRIGVAFSNQVGYNFEGAKKITFYAMDQGGGVNVQFKAVGNDQKNGTTVNDSTDNLFKNQEFALTSQNVTLNETWGYFEMSLDDVQSELSNVKYPFALEVTQGNGAPIVLYVKGIRYSSEPIDERYLLQPSSLGNLTASTLSNTTSALNVTLSDNATESVPAPATVEFGSTVSNGQEPYSFDWDFGDGVKETHSDGNLTHTFATPGLYNVTANVIDSSNNTGSANTMVDVIAQNQTQSSESITPQNTTGSTTTPITTVNNRTDQFGSNSSSNSSSNNTSSNSTTAAENDEESPSVTGDTKPNDGSTTDETNNNQTEQTGDNGTSTTNDNSTARAVIGNEESHVWSMDTSTGDSSTTGSEPEANNNSTETETSASSDSAPVANSPPVANAGNDLVGKPNEKVILDANKSMDPDPGDKIESYQWDQESGPTAKINDKGSPTPIVTLPDVDKDTKLVFSLKVNDGTADSQKKDTVSVFVDHIDKLANDVQIKALKPSYTKSSDWIAAGDCSAQDDVSCLSDASGGTFVSAGTENIGPVNLYAFEKFGPEGTLADENSTVVIDRVTAEIIAKKTGNTGYVSFAIDNPHEKEHYFTPGVSIASSAFQKYNYVWDVNPITGEKWTQDSLNSLIAGFKYDGGQSDVQISELQLTISYHNLPAPTTPENATPSEEAASTTAPHDASNAEDSSGSGSSRNSGVSDDSGNKENNGTTDTQDVNNESGGEEQQVKEAPATTETDSTNSTNSDAVDENNTE
jgi:hypothetical protein